MFGIDADGANYEVDYKRDTAGLIVTCFAKTRMAELRVYHPVSGDTALLEFDAAAGVVLRTVWNRKRQQVTRTRRYFIMPEGLGLPLPQRGPYSRAGWLSARWWLPGAESEPVEVTNPKATAQRLARLTRWAKEVLEP